jgi:PST family polysaccharide transporter
VLIGWRYGALELGYYTRAYGLLLLPRTLLMWPIGSSVLPALCRLQHDPERWRRRFLEALSAIVLVSSPLTAVLIAGAKPLIILLFGAAWSEATDIFQFLAISMFAATPLNAMGWLYVSTGRTDRMFRWSLMITPVIVVAFFVGLPFGASGLALAYSSVICLALVPGLAFAARQSPVGTWDMLRAIAPATAVGIVSALLGLAARDGYAIDDPFTDLFATGFFTAAVYAAGGLAVVCLDPALRPLRSRIAGWLTADRHMARGRLRDMMARVSR